MLDRVVIGGYRSIRHLEFRLRRLNVVWGPNGSGKSNLYKALRLLACTAQGGLPKAIAREGGTQSILNEPENSLHPDVLPPLASLIRRAASRSQVWVTTHSQTLASLLAEAPESKVMTLEKIDGETRIAGQGLVLNNGD